MKNNLICRDIVSTGGGVMTAGLRLGASLLSAKGYKPLIGVNKRILIGFIVFQNQDLQLLNLFMRQLNLKVAALCDIYKACFNLLKSYILNVLIL